MSLPDPAGVKVVRVETTAQLQEHVLEASASADAVVMAAAPADFRPESAAASKIKKSEDGSSPEIRLTQNPDILAGLAHERPNDRIVVVGFAAETGDDSGSVMEHARAKLARKGCDLLVVNDVGGGAVFGSEDNEAVVLGADGSAVTVPLGSKSALAHVIWDRVLDLEEPRLGCWRPGPRPKRTNQPTPTCAGVAKLTGRLFTSESVTEGHPDKIADAISDTVLDYLLDHDSDKNNLRVAVETLLTTGLVVVAGEVRTNAYAPVAELVRKKILDIGYDSSLKGFDGKSCGVQVAIGGQSVDIAAGVDHGHESRVSASEDELDKQGAGDQGLMFGYACDDTPELMPLPITIAHRLSERLTEVRKDGTLDYLRPDGKTQVTIEYDDQDRPVRVDTVVLSTQHAEETTLETLEADIKKHVIDPVLASFDIPSEDYRLLVNPTGVFVVGGPMGDAGLTGRKIIVDTYGGMARHGGGAFSGKDPSKVDRSAAYAMRWVAKTIVAAGLAKRAEVQVAYAIGKAQPVGVFVQTFGTGVVSDEVIQKAVLEVFDLRPAAIIRDLDLLRPIYAQTSAYGHFGRELPDFTWENTDRADALRAAAGV